MELTKVSRGAVLSIVRLVLVSCRGSPKTLKNPAEIPWEREPGESGLWKRHAGLNARFPVSESVGLSPAQVDAGFSIPWFP